jgi:hypothetical protein
MSDLSKTPGYFTVVYRDVMPGDEARQLTDHPKVCAMAWDNLVRKSIDSLDDANEAFAEWWEKEGEPGGDRRLAYRAWMAARKI